MLEQPRGLGRHLPLVRVRQVALRAALIAADFVDDRVGLYSCSGVDELVAGDPIRLGLCAPPPLRLRNRGDQFGAPAALDDAIGRLSILVQLPMSGRMLYGELRIGRSKKLSSTCRPLCSRASTMMQWPR